MAMPRPMEAIAVVFAVFISMGGYLLPIAIAKTSEISKAEQAQGFNIFYGQNYEYKVVENLVSNTVYLLTENSSKVPGKNHCDAKLKSFDAPLVNYCVDSTLVPVSFLELLGVLDNLKGVTSELSTSACVMEYIADGDIKQISKGNPEQVLQFNAFLTSSSSTSSVADAIQHCNYINFDPLGELKPLQRAEWVKFLAALTDNEARANNVFKMVEDNYMCLNALAMNASTKPTVAWVTFDKDTWSFSNESYKLQYVIDAGGSNLEESVYISTFNMSLPLEVQRFHFILSRLDIVIDESYAAIPSDYTLPTFIENANISEDDMFPFIANESVWRYDKQIKSSCTVVNDWFDHAVAQPQLVLGDLIQAFHSQTNYTTIFLRNIAKGDKIIDVSSEKCTHNISTPVEPTLIDCNGLVIGR